MGDGTYWHLDTRPQELEELSDLTLKNAASRIDQKLNIVRTKPWYTAMPNWLIFVFQLEIKLRELIFNMLAVAVE